MITSQEFGGHNGQAKLAVLIVEDNDDCALSLATLLRLTGYEARIARDGPEALAAVDSFRPDVVILDLGLPGMSGYDVARAIKGTRRAKMPYLIVVSGWGQAEDRRRSAEAGIDLHLVKPVELEELEAALRSFHDTSTPVPILAKDRLQASPYPLLREICCEYHDGLLVLRGQLPNYFQKQLAQNAMRGLIGVREVANHIEVASTTCWESD